MKDPKVLRSTVFWMSNGGRHYEPWCGRHRHVIGLEEVIANFDYGLAESVESNSLKNSGFETCIELDSNQPTTVNYIMAVAAIPGEFDRGKMIDATPDGASVILSSFSGITVKVNVNLAFLVGAEASSRS